MSIESFFLDANDDYLPTYVQSTATLTAGVTYIIEVHGNFAWWINDNVPYGQVDDVIYLSASASGDHVASMDAETIYAEIDSSRTVPRHVDSLQELQFNLGSGFAHIHPDGGPFTTPDPNHRYFYTVVGEGAPLQAALPGPQGARNGKLLITIDVEATGLVVGFLQLGDRT